MVVACFEIFSPYLLGGSEKAMKNFGQDSVSSSWSLNVGLPECCVFSSSTEITLACLRLATPDTYAV